ncbi:MAG: hypothetical protein M1825_005947 [Sarcosagium campestre]|nr:MAG: hypothetical protein M1825_005947 [Sarcosagium campestre]
MARMTWLWMSCIASAAVINKRVYEDDPFQNVPPLFQPNPYPEVNWDSRPEAPPVLDQSRMDLAHLPGVIPYVSPHSSHGTPDLSSRSTIPPSWIRKSINRGYRPLSNPRIVYRVKDLALDSASTYRAENGTLLAGYRVTEYIVIGASAATTDDPMQPTLVITFSEGFDAQDQYTRSHAETINLQLTEYPNSANAGFAPVPGISRDGKVKRTVSHGYISSAPNNFWFNYRTGRGALATWWPFAHPFGRAYSRLWTSQGAFLDNLLKEHCQRTSAWDTSENLRDYNAANFLYTVWTDRVYGIDKVIPHKLNQILFIKEHAILTNLDEDPPGQHTLSALAIPLTSHTARIVWDISNDSSPLYVASQSGLWDLANPSGANLLYDTNMVLPTMLE